MSTMSKQQDESLNVLLKRWDTYLERKWFLSFRDQKVIRRATAAQAEQIAAKDAEVERLNLELVEARKWKEEDPRMLREQIRVADVAYKHLHNEHEALRTRFDQLKAAEMEYIEITDKHQANFGARLEAKDEHIAILRAQLDTANAAAGEMREALTYARPLLDDVGELEVGEPGGPCAANQSFVAKRLFDAALSTTAGTSLLRDLEQAQQVAKATAFGLAITIVIILWII